MNKDQKVNMDPNAKLSLIERFAYGVGDYSFNLVYSSISAFLLVYYVSVLGVSAVTAGSIMAVSRIFDGVSDLVMGRIVDKTHSKWGKARPWLLRLCVPLAVCFVLMFSIPSGLAGKAQIAYMFLTYNMVSTVFYTGMNVPYATLQGLMTTNQYERGLLGNIRNLLSTAGTMTVNTFVMKMCTAFGGGDQYSQKGWTMTFLILAVLFILLNLFTFYFCHERVVELSSGDSEEKQEASIAECLKSLVKNKYWLILVVFLFVMYFMMSTFFGSAYYFAQYILGDENVYAMTANALSMAQIIMLFCTPFIMKKFGKRNTGLFGMAIASAAFLLTALAGSNVNLVVAANVLKGLGFGCCGATMFGMLQDAITYGSWLTGVQAMGMGNAASSFCMKVGSGIGTAALGWILGAGGFNTDPTSAGALTALNISCIWIPLATCIIGAVCMLLFDLDQHYDQAVADLAEGRWKGSK